MSERISFFIAHDMGDLWSKTFIEDFGFASRCDVVEHYDEVRILFCIFDIEIPPGLL